jgi:hypothetical protein|tara:strand:- start:289 stop:573 length:285 start_codon:yes stop_codon:yes gene_type:complete
MYAKERRITLAKDGWIVVAGKRSWITIGYFNLNDDGSVYGWIAPIKDGFSATSSTAWNNSSKRDWFGDGGNDKMTKKDLRTLAMQKYLNSFSNK